MAAASAAKPIAGSTSSLRLDEVVQSSSLLGAMARTVDSSINTIITDVNGAALPAGQVDMGRKLHLQVGGVINAKGSATTKVSFVFDFHGGANKVTAKPNLTNPEVQVTGQTSGSTATRVSSTLAQNDGKRLTNALTEVTTDGEKNTYLFARLYALLVFCARGDLGAMAATIQPEAAPDVQVGAAANRLSVLTDGSALPVPVSAANGDFGVRIAKGMADGTFIRNIKQSAHGFMRDIAWALSAICHANLGITAQVLEGAMFPEPFSILVLDADPYVLEPVVPAAGQARTDAVSRAIRWVLYNTGDSAGCVEGINFVVRKLRLLSIVSFMDDMSLKTKFAGAQFAGARDFLIGFCALMWDVINNPAAQAWSADVIALATIGGIGPNFATAGGPAGQAADDKSADPHSVPPPPPVNLPAEFHALWYAMTAARADDVRVAIDRVLGGATPESLSALSADIGAANPTAVWLGAAGAPTLANAPAAAFAWNYGQFVPADRLDGTVILQQSKGIKNALYGRGTVSDLIDPDLVGNRTRVLQHMFARAVATACVADMILEAGRMSRGSTPGSAQVPPNWSLSDTSVWRTSEEEYGEDCNVGYEGMLHSTMDCILGNFHTMVGGSPYISVVEGFPEYFIPLTSTHKMRELVLADANFTSRNILSITNSTFSRLLEAATFRDLNIHDRFSLISKYTGQKGITLLIHYVYLDRYTGTTRLLLIPEDHSANYTNAYQVCPTVGDFSGLTIVALASRAARIKAYGVMGDGQPYSIPRGIRGIAGLLQDGDAVSHHTGNYDATVMARFTGETVVGQGGAEFTRVAAAARSSAATVRGLRIIKRDGLDLEDHSALDGLIVNTSATNYMDGIQCTWVSLGNWGPIVKLRNESFGVLSRFTDAAGKVASGASTMAALRKQPNTGAGIGTLVAAGIDAQSAPMAAQGMPVKAGDPLPAVDNSKQEGGAVAQAPQLTEMAQFVLAQRAALDAQLARLGISPALAAPEVAQPLEQPQGAEVAVVPSDPAVPRHDPKTADPDETMPIAGSARSENGSHSTGYSSAATVTEKLRRGH